MSIIILTLHFPDSGNSLLFEQWYCGHHEFKYRCNSLFTMCITWSSTDLLVVWYEVLRYAEMVTNACLGIIVMATNPIDIVGYQAVYSLLLTVLILLPVMTQ